jgi:hypothetical protein
MGFVLGLLLSLNLPTAVASPTEFFPAPEVKVRALRHSPYFVSNANELCARAHLNSLEFIGVSTVASVGNYCEYAIENLPSEVRGALEEMIRIQQRIAAALEIGSLSLFGAGHHVVLQGFSVGSIGSRSAAGNVSLAVLPNWTLRDFPSMVYAHELIHVIWQESGLFSRMTEGLSLHPLLTEAFPDLVAAVAFDSPIVLLGETAFPDALRRHRNASPPRSFDEPFRNFYRFANLDALKEQCLKLDLAREISAVAVLCSLATTSALESKLKDRKALAARGAVGTSFEEPDLELPFRPEFCLTKTRNGLTIYDGCDSHQFAPPLVAFFFRLREALGRHALADFLRGLSASARAAPVFECGYAAGASESGGRKVILKKPSLVEAFRSLRSALELPGQLAFDRAWEEGAFGKFADFDRLYQTRVFASRAAIALARANDAFAKNRGCAEADLYEMDPERCRIECREKTL